MREKVLIVFMILLTSTTLFGGDVFFSEYIKGSGQNKALEIYNGTDRAIDLKNYRIAQSSNGGWEYYHEWTCSTILQPGDVWVITTDQDNSALQNETDEILSYPSVVHFSGNDARGLEITTDSGKTWILIDVIGVADENPGNGWFVAGVDDATKEHTLVRKPTVLVGNIDWPSSAGSSGEDSEWIVYNKDTFDYIGFHIASSNENILPIANAGIDQVVGFSSNVTLDGSGCVDPDGVITAYLWVQIEGINVILNNANQSIATLTAPNSESVLKFELTVTDDSSATNSDTVIVSVVDGSPSKLIISEYVEGGYYNKYLEIYNGYDTSVNLESEGYEIRISRNGNNDFKNVICEWGSLKIMQPGAVLVLANTQHSLYASPDTLLGFINFNGNDAVGLFRNGLLVDIVGEPDNSQYIIKDMTLRRKSTFVNGNPVFTISEWTEFPKDDIEGLGEHSVNPNAPTIESINISPEFVTSANEIEISAVITPVVGVIITVMIKYGADENLVNGADCWLENPTTNLWLGYLPSQSGNSKLSYKIVATDDSGNSGESQVSSFLVASNQATDISYIHENIEMLTSSIVTICGIMTIGDGVLRDDITSAYIQDTSGKGLNLYHSQFFTDMNRGDEILAVGYVDQYYSTIEVKDFTYKRMSAGNALPTTQTVTITEANSGVWEGTLIKFYGKIANITEISGGNKIKVTDGTDTTLVMVWGTTGIDINNYSVDNSYWFRGVESKYNDIAQLLVGYSEDIGDEVAIDEKIVLSAVFSLNSVYPNPFNPSTNIDWQLDKSCDYELAAFNLLGQKVNVISEGFGLEGSYTKTWNANNLPTGVYFIQLSSGNRKLTQKVILLK